MSNKFISVLMGSDSDLSTVQTTLDTLNALAIPFEVKITSAHRTPDDTRRYVFDAEERGCAVFVAAAGLAAHLAGFPVSRHFPGCRRNRPPGRRG